MKKLIFIFCLIPFVSCGQKNNESKEDTAVTLPLVYLMDYKMGDTLIQVEYDNGAKSSYHKRDFDIDHEKKQIKIGGLTEEFGISYIDEEGNTHREPPTSYYEQIEYQFEVKSSKSKKE